MSLLLLPRLLQCLWTYSLLLPSFLSLFWSAYLGIVRSSLYVLTGLFLYLCIYFLFLLFFFLSFFSSLLSPFFPPLQYYIILPIQIQPPLSWRYPLLSWYLPSVEINVVEWVGGTVILTSGCKRGNHKKREAATRQTWRGEGRNEERKRWESTGKHRKAQEFITEAELV